MQFFFFNLDMCLDVTEWCTRSVISVLVRVKNSVWTSASTNMSGCPVWKSLSPRTADMGSEHQTPYLMVNIPHPLWNPSSVKKKNSIMLNKQNRESYCSCSEMSLNKYSHFAQGRYCYSKTNLFSSWKRILSHSNKPFHGEYLLQRTCQWKHFVHC